MVIGSANTKALEWLVVMAEFEETS